MNTTAQKSRTGYGRRSDAVKDARKTLGPEFMPDIDFWIVELPGGKYGWRTGDGMWGQIDDAPAEGAPVQASADESAGDDFAADIDAMAAETPKPKAEGKPNATVPAPKPAKAPPAAQGADAAQVPTRGSRKGDDWPDAPRASDVTWRPSQPPKKPGQCPRADTLERIVFDLAIRPEGASAEELVEATGVQTGYWPNVVRFAKTYGCEVEKRRQGTKKVRYFLRRLPEFPAADEKAAQ